MLSAARTGFFLLCATLAIFSGAQQESQNVPPIRGFLIVEPFETRVEFLLQAEPLREFLKLGDRAEFEAANVRDALEKRAADWPGRRFSTGDEAKFELTRVEFVKPDPELGIKVDDRGSIPVSEGQVGLVFTAQTVAPPESIDLTWNFFTEEIQTATVEFGSPGNWSARVLTPDSNTLRWENLAGQVKAPTLDEIPVPNSRKPLNLPPATIVVVIGIGFVIAIGRAKKSAPRWLGFGLIACIAGAILLRGARPIPLPNPFSKAEVPTAETAGNVVYALLKNIYTAFEYRVETDIYDTLERSVTGDLLEQIYLEIQASLQLENQGGARVRVYNIDLKQCDPTGSTEVSGFVANCNWITAGTVTHWGHTHERTNRYEAVLTVDPAGDAWKLSDLKLVNEERIDQKSTKNQ
ncbi:MAG: hypothetical protein HKN23_20360 [Verrucomicrobiales bacterium]|nr:hypothetical protein [Verrucomicrobiales bacterium]